MKKKFADIFNSIFSFVKSHSIGTGAVALCITAAIVFLACKDLAHQAPGDKDSALGVLTSSSEETGSQDETPPATDETESSEAASTNSGAQEEPPADPPVASKQEEAAKKPQKAESTSATTVKDPEGADPNPMKTYEENKKKHENEVQDYLKEHNIDPKTAGETGELCPHCGKKIWDNNKYGLGNPGFPPDYESKDSQHCDGSCGITLG